MILHCQYASQYGDQTLKRENNYFHYKHAEHIYVV